MVGLFGLILKLVPLVCKELFLVGKIVENQ
jgi:hypothetical protein